MNNLNSYAVQSKALIYQGELDYISKCVLDYPDIETGGDLFGFWTYSGFPVIQYVIGPGPKSNHQVAFFNQDLDYLINIGDNLRNTHGLQHIGEWHSHHKLGLAEPSGHDVTTVTNAINSYNLGKFFLVIANIRETASSINGFMFRKEQGRKFDYSGWVVLDGESPIRNSFDPSHRDLIYRPKTTLSNIEDLTISTLKSISYSKPEYGSNYWLNEKSNHLVLKQILDHLSGIFKEVKVLQNEDDMTLFLQFQHNYSQIILKFPADFPLVPPIIERDGEDLLPIGKRNNFCIENNDLAYSTIEYIKNTFGLPKKTTIIQKLLNKYDTTALKN